MKVRADAVAMLREGHSQIHVMRTLRVSHSTVKAAREYLGLPAPGMGRRRIEPLADAFAARTEPVDGGHMRWTGYRTSNGVAKLGNGFRVLTARQAAFILRYDREPVGRVMPGCDMAGCVAPDHVVDKPMRERNAAAFAAIFGDLPSEEESSDA